MARTGAIVGCCAAVSLALVGCGGGNKASPPTTVSTTTGEASTVAESTTATSSPVTTTTSTVVPPTTQPCPAVAGSTNPVASLSTTHSVLLTSVRETTGRCTDRVVFDFTGKTADPPGYALSYRAPPIAEDASGAAVTVAGSAFIVVTVKPGYGYDFETGASTYTGAKRIATPGAHHVRELVETGDFEGVLNWVIGVDARRPFAAHASGSPTHQLVITIS